MSSFIQNIAKARILTIGLGLLATTAPVFAQAPETPAAPAAVAVPATDPQAKALFDQTVERYRKAKTLSIMHSNGSSKKLIQFSAPATAKVTSLDDKGELTSLQVYTPTETIIMQKPNDVFEYTSSPRVLPADGTNPRNFLANTNIGGIAFPSFVAGLDPFREGVRYKSSSFTKGEATTVDGVAVTPIVVTTVKAEKQPFDLTYIFYVGTEDKLVHRIEAKLKMADGKEQVITDNFTDIKIDGDAPAGTFDFTPPAGATKVEKFSNPTVRAKVGALPLSLPAGAKDIDGKEITFEQFKGKVTLVDFWATWCGPCIGELPNVKANYDKYKGQGFDVLGISLDQSVPPLTKFIKEKEMPWRQVYDGYWDGPIATSFNVRAIPATILIGKDGKIAAIGARGEELEPAIKAALAAN
ncbi:redoxin domain-containing protein [bacterium]|nr:MAG: redoxin domain-containing protein [bacterium]